MPPRNPYEGWSAEQAAELIAGESLCSYILSLKDVGANEDYIKDLLYSDLTDEKVFGIANRFAIQAGLRSMDLLEETQAIFENLAYHDKQSKPGKIRSILRKLRGYGYMDDEISVRNMQKKCTRKK